MHQQTMKREVYHVVQYEEYYMDLFEKCVHQNSLEYWKKRMNNEEFFRVIEVLYQNVLKKEFCFKNHGVLH